MPCRLIPHEEFNELLAHELLTDCPVLPVEVDRVLLADGAQRISEYKADFRSVRRSLGEFVGEKPDQPFSTAHQTNIE